MGSIKERLSNFFQRKAQAMFGISSRSIGGKFIMMKDSPQKYIEKGLLYNPDLSSVINHIKQTAVSVPWSLYSGDDKIDNHPILDVWQKGNPVTRGKRIFEQYLEHYLTTGNAFLYGVAPESGVNAGRFMEFWNLPYDMGIEKGGSMEPIKGYYYPNTRKVIDFENVLHWKTTNPDGDGYYGTSPLKAGRLLLTQSNDAYEANAKSLQNLGVRGMLIRKDLTNAGAEQAKKLKEEWKKEMEGAGKFNKLTIAGGDYDYINFGLSPVDLQLLEAQLRSRQGICNIYKFPSELLNDKSTSTYNNMQMIMKRLYTDIVIPLLEDFREIINPWWIEKWGDYEFRPDWSGVEALQTNKAETAQWLAQAWWINTQRKQELMGEEIDEQIPPYYIPAGLIPDTGEINADEALKQYMEATGTK